MRSIEVLAPVRLTDRRTGETRTFEPGVVSVPEGQAETLLKKAPERVRPVREPAPVTVGSRVTWASPLFGLLQGVVLTRTETTVTVHHPLTDREATLPMAWVTAVGP